MDDLISRQDAIDTAVEAADEWDGGYSRSREEIITMKLRLLPSAQHDRRWIPVAELPKEDGTYIVSGVWGSGKKQVGECEFYVHDGYFRTSWNFDVKAWMPMPEPYREDDTK